MKPYIPVIQILSSKSTHTNNMDHKCEILLINSNLPKNKTRMQEKSFVMQAGDSHFEQNSTKLAAKFWQLLAVMGHSMANQLWLSL